MIVRNGSKNLFYKLVRHAKLLLEFDEICCEMIQQNKCYKRRENTVKQAEAEVVLSSSSFNVKLS